VIVGASVTGSAVGEDTMAGALEGSNSGLTIFGLGDGDGLSVGNGDAFCIEDGEGFGDGDGVGEGEGRSTGRLVGGGKTCAGVAATDRGLDAVAFTSAVCAYPSAAEKAKNTGIDRVTTRNFMKAELQRGRNSDRGQSACKIRP
jgi:hypothetical protein